MDEIRDDELKHYGTPRHSGRYPWGSGKDPQRSGDFSSYVKDLKKQGMSEADIARGMGISTTQLRAKVSLDVAAYKADQINQVRKLAEHGYSNVEIGNKMGLPESTVRNYRKDAFAVRNSSTENIANQLKSNVDSKGFIDIGAGVELDLGVAKTKMDTAIAMLQEQGYTVHTMDIEQVSNPGKYTKVKVLAPPDTKWGEVRNNLDKINTITDYSNDNGVTFEVTKRPSSLDSERVMVRYGNEGGAQKDGVIELRPGVEDISLGNSRYAQVRIMVDGTHYLKGMAMYGNEKDFPPGTDVIFNTNKNNVSKLEAMKKIKDDPDNPFGALIKAGGQREYVDPATGETKLSPINKLKEEGDWSEYSKTLSSQFLSKQNMPLIKRQLNMSLTEKKAEFDEIMSLTNSEVRKKLLESFADDCDASAVHLKAAALPKQQTQVILPITDMKDNEIYAPNYKEGTQVCLIRYPHGGVFEIPTLTVNNKQKTAKGLLGNAQDAVGINSKVAERLSGADFDGDTVMVIPISDKVKIKTSAPLKQLEGFDPKEAYPAYPGMPKMKSQTKQTEMGKVSNLITDMTLKGAHDDEIARAVKHSMVVIDAEKHNLNYKQSYIDNGIAELKAKYQGVNDKTGQVKGASTLISRSKSEIRVGKRKEGSEVVDPETGKKKKLYIDPETGKKLYTELNETYTTVSKTGKVTEHKRLQTSTKMAETDDARTLSSGHPKEEEYAKYANELKSLANQARLAYVNTPNTTYSPSAKKTYAAEVDSLSTKLTLALKNKPRERQAQLMASTVVTAKKKANPDMTKEEEKKVKTQALSTARARYGASKSKVNITEKEWEAIQAGAISNNKLKQVLDNTDIDVVRTYATPRQSKNNLSNAQVSKIKAMENSGYTTQEIAESLGISTTTVSKYAK